MTSYTENDDVKNELQCHLVCKTSTILFNDDVAVVGNKRPGVDEWRVRTGAMECH